jgi:hypothetical protein
MYLFGFNQISGFREKLCFHFPIWSQVKNLSCDGDHLGIPINKKKLFWGPYQKIFLLRNKSLKLIPVNPPPLRGSLPRKSLISPIDWVSCTGDINLPHTPFPPARSPPNKKIKYNKILTYICDQYFWKFPIWNSRADEKRREIRMVKVFKWYLVIDLFDTLTGKLGRGD